MDYKDHIEKELENYSESQNFVILFQHFENARLRQTYAQRYVNFFFQIKLAITRSNKELKYVLLASATSFTLHLSDWIQLNNALKVYGITLLVISNDGTLFIPFDLVSQKALQERYFNFKLF